MISVDSVILGDCSEVLKQLPDDSIDCVVTDPPYGLAFMGKEWDKALPPKKAFSEMCRVLKPGALAFVMSSPRQDLMWRMAQLLEESGFTLGQSFISWVYASGFPKAYDVSKGIDNKKGLKRKEKGLSHWYSPGRKDLMETAKQTYGDDWRSEEERRTITEPSSDDAKRWDGWKSITGLKPALEVVFMVQKPMSEKTIVENVLKHGVGAINVDATRIPIENNDKALDFGNKTQNPHPMSWDKELEKEKWSQNNSGRFPANLLVSDDALNDGKTYKSRPDYRDGEEIQSRGIYGEGYIRKPSLLNDSGSFSRYFDLDAWAVHHGFLNVPKAGTGEREYGLYLGDKKEPKSKLNLSNGSGERFDGAKLNRRRNVHPTVKPVELMGYLIELGCPKGGIVLDPFAGSGTTCVAAKKLRRRYIGIEIDPDYHKLAESRIAAIPISLDNLMENEIKNDI